MSKPEKTVIFLHETVMGSIVKDCVSFATLVAAIAVGVWIESNALQWIGGLMWIGWVLVRSLRSLKDTLMTPQAAADKLAREFGVVGMLGDE